MLFRKGRRAGILGAVLVSISAGGLPALAADDRGAAATEPFLKIQRSVGVLLKQEEAKLFGDPPSLQKDLDLKRIRMRLEAAQERGREMLQATPSLEETAKAQGLVFDGARWCTRDEACERILALSKAIEDLSIKRESLKPTLRDLERQRQERRQRKDQSQLQGALAAKGSQIGALSGSPSSSGPITTENGSGYRGGRVPTGGPRKKEKDTRKESGAMGDLVEEAKARLRPILQIPDIEEALFEKGCVETDEGTWVKIEE